MNDQQPLRYSRHVLLEEIGFEGRQRLFTSRVFAPPVGITGTLQAAEAFKLLAGIERGLSGKLLTLNALDMNVMRSTLSRDPICRVCGEAGAADSQRADHPIFARSASGTCDNQYD